MSSSNNATFTASIVRLNGDEYPCGGDNRVEIPYGEEYKIVVKNQMGKRRAFKIFVDGESLSGSRKFVLRPYQTMEVERFLEGDMQSGRKLQWMPLDHKSVKHKKGRVETGMVRIKMWKEASTITSSIIYGWVPPPAPPYRPWFENEPYWRDYTTCEGPAVNYCMSQSDGSIGSSAVSAHNTSLSLDGGSGTFVRNAVSASSPEGATGKGGYSGQKFNSEAGFNLDHDVDEVQFFLVPPGYQITTDADNEEYVVVEAVYCVRCGMKRKKGWKYCPQCGENF